MMRELKGHKVPGLQDVKWFFSETITGTSAPVRISSIGQDPYVVVNPLDGIARVETTASSYDDIQQGTALWVPWHHGDVTTLSDGNWIGAVTAMRLVANGTAYWEIVR